MRKRAVTPAADCARLAGACRRFVAPNFWHPNRLQTIAPRLPVAHVQPLQSFVIRRESIEDLPVTPTEPRTRTESPAKKRQPAANPEENEILYAYTTSFGFGFKTQWKLGFGRTYPMSRSCVNLSPTGVSPVEPIRAFGNDRGIDPRD